MAPAFRCYGYASDSAWDSKPAGGQGCCQQGWPRARKQLWASFYFFKIKLIREGKTMPGSLGAAEELPAENSLQWYPPLPPVDQTLSTHGEHTAALLRAVGQGECCGGPGVCEWQGRATHMQRPRFVLTEKVLELWPLLWGAAVCDWETSR